MSALQIHRETKQNRTLALWLYAALLALYGLTVSGEFFSGDGSAMYATTDSLVLRGSLEIHNPPGYKPAVGWDDRTYSKYDLGQPLAAIPFYLVGLGLAKGLGHVPEHELTKFVTLLLPLFATALTGVVLFQLGYVLFQNSTKAIALALLWATGTLAWPYSKFYFAEALVTLLVVTAGYLAVRARQANSYTRLFAAGLIMGGAIAVRSASAIYVLAFLVFILADTLKGTVERGQKIVQLVKKSAVLLVGITPGIALCLAHNYIRFHDIFRTGYEAEGFTSSLAVGLPGLLVSSGRGLFVFSPLTLLGLCCLIYFRKRDGAFTLFALTAFLTALVFYAQWAQWYGGWAWGPRYLVPIVPFLILPLGYVLDSARMRSVIFVTWLVSVLIVLPGVLTDFIQYYKFQEGNGVRLQALYFDPAQSQILVQWSFLLKGQALTLLANRLSTVGLPSFMDWLYAPFLISILFVSLLKIWNVLHSERGRQSSAVPAAT